jgi:hypothetical protein
MALHDPSQCINGHFPHICPDVFLPFSVFLSMSVYLFLPPYIAHTYTQRLCSLPSGCSYSQLNGCALLGRYRSCNYIHLQIAPK